MTTFHMRVDLRGVLVNNDKTILRSCRHDDGHLRSVEEARESFLDLLLSGTRYVPGAPCDNWDPERGCLGHEEVQLVAP